jgi:hypothetical protein
MWSARRRSRILRSHLHCVILGAGVVTLAFYDFFAGSGLVTLALSGDWSCVWANNIDSRNAEVYEANFGSDRFHLGDIADVSSCDLPRGADMAWASFPCQDLSLAGWRRGMTARQSGTFWEFRRVMNELWHRDDRPPLIESPRILVTSVVSKRRYMLRKNYQNSLQLLVPIHTCVILSMGG